MSQLPRSTCFVAASALVAGGFAFATPAVAADDVNTTLCAGTPVWTGDLTPGQTVTGKTTTRGTTVEGFTGEYIDALNGGTDDDTSDDILLFKLSGSRITDADGKVDAGIWAGISGSPVYDADGNLIGSVSYGFTEIAGSQVAGVTPAANIFATKTAGAEPVAKSQPVSPKARVAMKAAGEQSAPRIKPLTLPRVTVGSQAASHDFFAKKSRTLSSRDTALGTPTGSAQGINTIEPGGNIASSWSSGNTLFASVGTVTAVCGNEVYAFGHPDEGIGASSQTFHSASVATIQEDGAYSFKLANINTVPAGALVEDGNNGIYGVVGQAPKNAISVKSTTTYAGTSKVKQSSVSEPLALSTVIANQVFSGLASALGNTSGPGDIEMSWTINYTPAGSTTAQSFSRTQRFSGAAEVASLSIQDVAGDTEFLQLATDTDLTINSVDVTSNVLSRKNNTLRVSHLDYLRNGKWLKLTPQVSKAYQKKGTTLQTRIQLVPSRGSSAAAQTVASNYSTSKSWGSTGRLALQASMSDYEDEYDEDFDEIFYDESWDEDYEEGWDYSGPFTLPEALKILGDQKRSDALAGSLRYTLGGSGKLATRAYKANAVTTGLVAYPVVFQK